MDLVKETHKRVHEDSRGGLMTEEKEEIKSGERRRVPRGR